MERSHGTRTQERYRWVAVTAVAVLTVLIAAFLYYRYESHVVSEAAYRELGGIAKLKVGQLQAWRKNQFTGALELSQDPLLRRVILRYLRAPRSSDRAQIVDHLRAVKDAVGYQSVAVATPGGPSWSASIRRGRIWIRRRSG